MSQDCLAVQAISDYALAEVRIAGYPSYLV